MGMRSLVISALLVPACAVIAVACGSFSSAPDSVGAPDGSAEGGGSGDGATSGEAGAPAPDQGVFCGGPTPFCDPKTEVCCQHLSGGGVGCLPAADAGVCRGTDLACDDGADCAFMPEGVCCAVPSSNGVDLQQSRCQTLQNCKKLQFYAVVCDPSAPSACPSNVACNVPDGGASGFCDGLLHL